jgi:hydroxymethylbilane synthase
MRQIRIGTRGSQLALWQAAFVESKLKQHFPELALERVIIKTEGDQDQQSSLTKIGGQGVFTKTLEIALLENKVDIAVHSLKDLPSTMTEGLILGAVPERGPVEDVLVTPDGSKLDELPEGATVASGSIRRRSQLLHIRPDLRVTDLRGNIDTRLRKLKTEDMDAIFMARAALVRLQLDTVQYYTFDPGNLIPAVGQGAIGIQIRDADLQTKELVTPLNHLPTYQAVTAERAVLNTLDSGCQFPVGAYASIMDDNLTIHGFVGSEDGKTVLKEKMSGRADHAFDIGEELANTLIKQGALSILH